MTTKPDPREYIPAILPRGKTLVHARAIAARAIALARVIPTIRAETYAGAHRRGLSGPALEAEAERQTALALVDFAARVTSDATICENSEQVARLARSLIEEPDA